MELTDKDYKEITQRVRDALKKNNVGGILNDIETNVSGLTYSRKLKSVIGCRMELNSQS